MTTQNITTYSDQELSLLFLNTESLYLQAQKAGDINELRRIANDNFIYTNDQITELEQDFFDGAFD